LDVTTQINLSTPRIRRDKKGDIVDILLLLGIITFVIAAILAQLEKNAKILTIVFMTLTVVIFFFFGATTFIGKPAGMGKLESNVVYRVINQYQYKDGEFITTVKTPNDAFRLITRQEPFPAPLFVVKKSFWTGAETVEEFIVER